MDDTSLFIKQFGHEPLTRFKPPAGELTPLDQARNELAAEQFRAEVDAMKARLKSRRPLWHRIFPFVITITRRTA